MLLKISAAIFALILLFLGYVSTRESKFNYERSAVINAPAAKIFPYISNFKLASQWNPYDQKDPNVKRTFSGPDGQAGSVMEFDGNSEAGAGRLEMLKVSSDELVEINLTMTKPMKADNLIQYRLTPEGTGTRFTWAMSGDGGFLGKLISVFIDCEKMIGGDFEKGIANLKKLVESPAGTPQ